ncbi:small acid-soluble spore protein O [Peribacillus acanthi]|uniref:small acid-soluble spore protein O n=1 Tax=Peribacillus acanthi TaxID=2171554 RepID=UPI000D3E6419|nr:small acid-soluble spore protein O [Peribacillus acanthi]
MPKRKGNLIPGGNGASAQGQNKAYGEEFAVSNEPLSEAERQNNKKRKKNQ